MSNVSFGTVSAKLQREIADRARDILSMIDEEFDEENFFTELNINALVTALAYVVQETAGLSTQQAHQSLAHCFARNASNLKSNDEVPADQLQFDLH